MDGAEIKRHVAITKRHLKTWPASGSIYEFLKDKTGPTGSRGLSCGIPGPGWWFGVLERYPGQATAFLQSEGIVDEESEPMPARSTELKAAADWIRAECNKLVADMQKR